MTHSETFEIAQITTEEIVMQLPPTISPTGLPPMLTVPQAARVLGIGRTLAYELVRTHAWPTPVIRAGRLIKIPTAPLLELLATGRLPGSEVA
ncbi:MAG: helix-turn-helix domain-containing protein [Jatrophihabitantaceae bacterium]